MVRLRGAGNGAGTDTGTVPTMPMALVYQEQNVQLHIPMDTCEYVLVSTTLKSCETLATREPVLPRRQGSSPHARQAEVIRPETSAGTLGPSTVYMELCMDHDWEHLADLSESRV